MMFDRRAFIGGAASSAALLGYSPSVRAQTSPFRFLVLDDPSAFPATFDCNQPHIVRMPGGRGIAVSRVVTAGFPAHQKISLVSEDLSTVTSLFDAWNTAQSPMIQATSEGHLFAGFFTWAGSAGSLTLMRCQDPAVTPSFTTTWSGGAGSPSGKQSMVLDEAGTIWIAGNNTGLFPFDLDGNPLAGQWAWTDGTYPVEYPCLKMAPSGLLVLGWTTYDPTLPLNYRTLRWACSPDGGKTFGPCGNGPFAAGPMPSDSGTAIHAPGEDDGYKFLMDMLPTSQHLHCLYAYNRVHGRQFYVEPETTVCEYVRFDIATGAITKRLKPFRTATMPYGMVGGGFAIRGSSLYIGTTSANGPSVSFFKSSNSGDDWSDAGSSPVPVTGQVTLYSLCVDPGQPGDPNIPFVVTASIGDPSTIGSNPAKTVMGTFSP